MAKTKTQAAGRARAAHQADPERWTRLFIIGGVVVVLAVVAGIVAFGWYQTQIAPRGKTILQVGETKISLGYLEDRMELQLEQNPSLAQQQGGALLLLESVLINLESEAKLLEAAAELGITVSDEEVDARIREQGNISEGSASSAFVAELSRQVEESGLSEDQYLQMIRAQILDGKVREHFAAEVPERAPHVRARMLEIPPDQEEAAQQALQILQAGGENFQSVAAAFAAAGVANRDITWGARGTLPSENVEEFLFDEAQPRQLSDVISAPNALYIVRLLERDEDREVDETQRQQLASREMAAWLSSLDASLSVERNLSDEDRARAVNDVFG